jgi:hypothetical protein
MDDNDQIEVRRDATGSHSHGNNIASRSGIITAAATASGDSANPGEGNYRKDEEQEELSCVRAAASKQRHEADKREGSKS